MKKYNPTTPSRRHMTAPDYRSVLSGVKPEKKLTMNLQERAGRNNRGRITMRHQGAGNKRTYRIIDFRRNDKLNIPARIESLEYDPYRTAFIMKLIYKDGTRRYSIAPQGAKAGSTIVTAENAEFVPGNRLMLKNIPVGYSVFNIELNPGKGGQIVRSAGSSAEVLGHDAGYTQLKMPSGEIRKVLWSNFATLGQVSNADWGLVNIGKAGRTRGMGVRPTVRGTVMNPVDHPYGGGEGRQPRGTKKPKTKWGKITGGRKTRNQKKWSNVLITKRRLKKKK
ncbi:MAG TPA: 50S ribosomal protein L2 [Candidatus Colwellbacteria bacterium]|nr:50S ribosomal protein L2 [Candidatus Colwellbacteria bacterium]HQA96209.1 50S ribosomal protein L2 [Candidatus Colwellbacteria bacterium]